MTDDVLRVVAVDEDRRSLDAPAWQHVAGALGGFGAGTLVGFSGEPLWWPVAALVAGMLHGRAKAAAWAGVLASAVTFALFDGAMGRRPAYEWSGLEGYGYVLGIAGLGLASAVLVRLGGRLVLDRSSRVAVLAAAVSAGVGLGAVFAAAATWVILSAVPADRSFELTLPAGWIVLERETPRPPRQPAWGDDFTAVLGSDERPQGNGPARHPTVGVSVVRAEARAEDCLRVHQGWPPVDSPLYDAELVSWGPDELPVGPAYVEVRAPEPEGSRLHAFAMSRVRRVGLVLEPLCYALVITVPAGAPIDDAGVRAIAESFRFR